MKISKILFSILISSFFIVFSCDDEETVELYEPQIIDVDSTSLAYEKLSTYPLMGSIQSANPTISDIETPYGFRILNISSPSQSNFVQAAFTIDRESGIISYGNINNTISTGTFFIDVGVVNTNGMAVYENAFELIILDVPLEVVIDKNEVEAGIFELGLMATISYTDTSGSDEITSATYKLINPPVGFEINSSTGAISKVKGAASGPNSLSVEITTNVGVVMASNVLTVNVGESPTIEMLQQDGSTSLTKTVLSPNTAYTTSSPEVTGMDPTNWEVVLPTSLLNSDLELGEIIDFSSSFSVEEPSGKVSIAADAGLPLGTHTIGLKATNATGDEFEFKDVLTIEVEDRWGTIIYEPSDFDAFTGVTLYHLDSPTTFLATNDNHGMAKMPVVKWQSINGAGNSNRIDAAMELKIPILDPSIRKARISFYEASGYNNFYVTRHERKVYSYQASDTTPPAADPLTWNLMIDNDDSMWSTISQWPALKEARDVTNTAPDITLFNKMEGKTVSVSSDTQNLYFFLRLTKVSDEFPTQGQWIVADFMVEASLVFPAEEQ
tara:strand:+ start:2937 stop:4598 length:1662 start_codon:yes stop_codon:yes gene_type:complete